MIVSESNQPLGGVGEPYGDVTVRKNWVFQFHVRLDGAAMATVVESVEPDAATLPVPVQPVQTYCVPEPPDTGDVTLASMTDPESNQPLGGLGEPYAEVSVR